MMKTAFLRVGVGTAFLVAVLVAFGMGINYSRAHAPSGNSLQYFLRFHGRSLVDVSLPQGWNQSTQTGQSGYTATYAAPSGNEQATVSVEAFSGANHDEVNGSGAFDPAAALPSGCALNGQRGNIYTFVGHGGYDHGAIYTTPALSGAIVLTVQSAEASVWQTALKSFVIHSSVAASVLSGQP